jgi:uncharacterized protein YkwD
MDRCDVCGDGSFPQYGCRRCGRTHCDAHRLPEHHDCPGLSDTPRPSPNTDSRASTLRRYAAPALIIAVAVGLGAVGLAVVENPVDGALPTLNTDSSPIEQQSGGTPTAQQGVPPHSGLNTSRIERAIHAAVNDQRRDHGLPALAWDSDLAGIARGHSQDMAVREYFAHESPGGGRPGDRYERAGYECRAARQTGGYATAAENIAKTYPDTPLDLPSGTVEYDDNESRIARGIVRQWMRSPGHRENILRRAWDDQGIGVAVQSTNVTDPAERAVLATQNFC